MKFQCTSCGRKLSVPDAKAGKKGRCPKCKEVLTIPAPAGETEKSPHDLELLDVPPSHTSEPAPATETDESAAAYEQLQGALGGRLMEREELPERQHPWILDIFLYPLNLSALTMLLICVGGPFFLRIVVQFFRFGTSAIQILIIFWVVSLMVHWAALLLLVMYVYWYFCQCMRDSAEGQIRATETLAETPGLGELLGQTFKLIFCALLCLAPAIILWAESGGDMQLTPWLLSGPGNFLLTMVLPVEVLRHLVGAENIIPLVGSIQGVEPVFWILWGAGNCIFPMLVLAMVLHESFFSALNPILIVRSILRTFFQYCILAPVCCMLTFSLSMIYYLILSPHWHLAYVVLALAFYQILVMAHLLGRFYWKNQEKLDWDA